MEHVHAAGQAFGTGPDDLCSPLLGRSMRVGDDAADSACEICSGSTADGRVGTDRSTLDASRRFPVGPNPGGAAGDPGQRPALREAAQVVALDDEPHRTGEVDHQRRGAVLERRARRHLRARPAPGGPAGPSRRASAVPVKASSASRPSAPCTSTVAMSLSFSRASPASSYSTSPSTATTGTRTRERWSAARASGYVVGSRSQAASAAVSSRRGGPVVAGEPGVGDHAGLGGVGLEHASILAARPAGRIRRRATRDQPCRA